MLLYSQLVPCPVGPLEIGNKFKDQGGSYEIIDTPADILRTHSQIMRNYLIRRLEDGRKFTVSYELLFESVLNKSLERL